MEIRIEPKTNMNALSLFEFAIQMEITLFRTKKQQKMLVNADVAEPETVTNR